MVGQRLVSRWRRELAGRWSDVRRRRGGEVDGWLWLVDYIRAGPFTVYVVSEKNSNYKLLVAIQLLQTARSEGNIKYREVFHCYP